MEGELCGAEPRHSPFFRLPCRLFIQQPVLVPRPARGGGPDPSGRRAINLFRSPDTMPHRILNVPEHGMIDAYENQLRTRGFKSDPAQRAAAQRLQGL